MVDMLVTPDYGLSDIWHFNFPLKQLLSDSLRSGKFPLWTDLVGNGFPIAAEGQIGAFSPLNWIIFGVIPMPLAFSIAIVFSFLILGLGAYFFTRALRLPRPLCVAAAVFSSVNGYFIVQATHLNLLQSFSFIPWAFLFTERLLERRRRRDVLLLGMVLTQMMLVGYPQTMVNAVFLLTVYALVRSPRRIVRNGLWIAFAVIIALLLSAVQIIPLFELVSQSDTVSAAARQRFVHPLRPIRLLTVFDPFLFGDPSKGTYPHRGPGQPVFWENLVYMGIVPLALIGVWFIQLILRGRVTISRSPLTAIGAVTIISLLLSLGDSTPLGVLFKIPPFSFTRVESRFLAVTHFGLGVLGVLWLSAKKKLSMKKVVVALVVFHVVQIGWTFRRYHLFGSSEQWLEPPAIARSLPKDARVMTRHQENIWNRFAPDGGGWYGKKQELLDARSTVGANSNIIFSIRHVGVYAQQAPRRLVLIQRNMYGNDSLGQNIRRLYGVTHVLDAETGTVRVISVDAPVPDISIPVIITHVSGPEEALGRMAQNSFQPGIEALWESDRMPREDEQIVVMNRSFYPGWSAYLDEQNIPIYPVNINQQAAVIPKDAPLSSLRFVYDPWSYKIGGLISLISLGAWIVLFRKFRYNSNRVDRH